MAVVAAAAVVLILVLIVVPYVLRRRVEALGNAAIGGPAAVPSNVPWPLPTPTKSPAVPGAPAYITAISADHRYFLDQYGRPISVRGDAPWSVVTRLGSADAQTYFRSRQSLGFNALILSLLGSVGNGGPRDDGGTFDGVQPFLGGDVTRLNPPYWARVHQLLADAARHGLTVFAYPLDAWVVGKAFRPGNQSACLSYGKAVVARLADLPNLVWMAGGDYLPNTKDLAAGTDVDHCIDAVIRGIRSTGDDRLFSVQLGYDGAFYTSQFPYWDRRADFNFVYSYYPSYRAVAAAYDSRPVRPALLGEANYERENNQPESQPTTNETLRRQVLWTLTAGGAGDFYGSSDWSFPPGWADRLDSPGARQVQSARDIMVRLGWWRLRPNHNLLVGGRGAYVDLTSRLDVLDNDYATAAVATDRASAVVYVPTGRTLTIDPTVMGGEISASWIDPSTGTNRPAVGTVRFTTPGRNADDGRDWLLVLRRLRR